MLEAHSTTPTDSQEISSAAALVTDCETAVKQFTRLAKRDAEFNEGEQRRQVGITVPIPYDGLSCRRSDYNDLPIPMVHSMPH